MANKKEDDKERRLRPARMQPDSNKPAQTGARGLTGPVQDASDAARMQSPEHQQERCLSDIKQFYENIKEVKRTAENEYILDLAAQYCEDTKFFLEKKDYATAFGSINYAHGLIDAYRKAKGEK